MYLHCVAMFSSRTNLYLIGLQALFALLLVIQSCAISFLTRTTNIPMTEKLENALQVFARVPLLNGPTTIQRLTRIEEVLGAERHGVNLFVKRDDEASLGGGGNKLRKLEFHLGAAKVAAVDTVLTVGGLQSNHARLTAAACARLGLTCELFLSRAVPRNDDNYERSGNVLLNNIFGANTHIVPSGESALEAAEKRAEQLRALGGQVLVIPTGGSTPLGCLGYASCALEISHQEAQLDKPFRQIIVPMAVQGHTQGLPLGSQCWVGAPELSGLFLCLQTGMPRQTRRFDLLGKPCSCSAIRTCLFWTKSMSTARIAVTDTAFPLTR